MTIQLSKAQQNALAEITKATDTSERGCVSESRFRYNTMQVLRKQGLVEPINTFWLRVTDAGRAALEVSLQPPTPTKHRTSKELRQLVRRRLVKGYYDHLDVDIVEEIGELGVTVHPSPTYQVTFDYTAGDALLHGAWKEGI